MRNAGLEEAQAGIMIARRNINNLRYADDTTHMAESEESFSLASTLAEQDVHHQEGLLSQNDWLKTTQKLMSLP